MRRGGQAPEWWNEEELKALSARVVRLAPNDVAANNMRAQVLSGVCFGDRSAAELNEAAAHYERTAALCPAQAGKAHFAALAALCRRVAEAM